MKLLFVDDSIDICEVVTIALQPSGWQVRVAYDGVQALAKVAEDKPDLILLDVRMPLLDGPGTLRRLRSDPLTADIPVIFMTGLGRQQDLERLEAMNPAGLLTKPFMPFELQRLIEACMAER